jgi:hypothetical protein
MATTNQKSTGRSIGLFADVDPLTVTFRAASQFTGLGLTTLWHFGKERRIRLVRPPGTRRTLIDYGSLKELLLPEPINTAAPRRRGRPRKILSPTPAENLSK